MQLSQHIRTLGHQEVLTCSVSCRQESTGSTVEREALRGPKLNGHHNIPLK
jgi:hypothetical protein